MSQPPPRPLHQADTSDGAAGTWAGVAPNLLWAATSAPAPCTDVTSTPEEFHAISQQLMAALPCGTGVSVLLHGSFRLAVDTRSYHLLPFVEGEMFRLLSRKSSTVHGLAPAEPDIQTSLCQKPEGFFGSVVTGIVGIEKDGHSALGKRPCPPFDFRNLFVSDLVRHDGYRRDTKGIQMKGIIETFHDDDAAAGDHLAVAWLLEAGLMLAEEFLSSMKVDRKPMFGWFFLLGSFIG